MGDSSDAEHVVRRLLSFVDRGVISVDEAATAAYEDAISVTPYLGHPDYTRIFNDRMGALIEACAQATGTSSLADPLGTEMRACQTGWNDWYGRWIERRASLRSFDQWDDPALATGIVVRLCDEALLDEDDRFVEAVARVAGEHGAASAVAAIVPVDDPDRYRTGGNHGSATAIRRLRQLADGESGEAREHLQRLAAVAEWTTWPLDG